jgi:RNA recognition motif-containing protein
MAIRIYVGNLPYTTDNEQLAQILGAFGEVTEATVVIDRDSGQSKGFGFVQMSDDDAARNAIAALNGTMLGDRNIRVSEAQPRPERSSGSRGGGDYGRGRSRDW